MNLYLKAYGKTRVIQVPEEYINYTFDLLSNIEMNVYKPEQFIVFYDKDTSLSKPKIYKVLIKVSEISALEWQINE